MKLTRIKKGEIGLIYRREEFNSIVTSGSHWLTFKESITIYNHSTVYVANKEILYVLKDENFLKYAEVIEVGDNEIVLHYHNKNLKAVLTAGQYFYFRGIIDFTFKKIDLNDTENEITKNKSLMQHYLMVPFRLEYKVENSQEGLLFIDGKFDRKMEKGVHYFLKNANQIDLLKVDARQVLMEVSGQEILTKDKAALRINFQVNYRLIDAVKALVENKDFEKQLYSLVQLSLREFMGTLTLDELLEVKEKISQYILSAVKTKAANLGIELIDAGIRDIILPGEVREIMNRVLIAQKNAEANTIARREETAATRSLLNTAKLMEENSMLFKLKEMEYIEKIADKIGEITVSSGGQVIDQLTKIFSK